LDKGIYTALSGAIAQTQTLDTISNNLANVDTIAFKKDEPVFKEYLTVLEKDETVNNVPKVEFKPSDFYHLYGNDKSFVSLDDVATNHAQGSTQRTGNSFDFALNGEGFFEVNTPLGIRYTRAGNFTIDPKGKLITQEGASVLAAPKTPQDKPEQREIIIPLNANINVTPDGVIWRDNQPINKLSVVEFQNTSQLNKAGHNMFAAQPKAAMKNIVNSAVMQGFIEKSNVNAVEEMVKLISTTRSYEGMQNAIKAYSDMAAKGTNEIANIGGT
jgi:flagellar basal-body rod protein FlgF